VKTKGLFIDLALKNKTYRLSCILEWPNSANWPEHPPTGKNLEEEAGEPQDIHRFTKYN